MTTDTTTDSAAVPARLDELLRPEVLAAFDRAAFEREGYWVWEGVLTEAGRERFTASLERLQQLNDDIIMATDWGAIDYAARGLKPPAPEELGIEARQRTLGGCEAVRCLPGDGRAYMHEHGLFGPEPTLVTPGVDSEGMMPEYWAAAYDGFILDVITAHPQMMELLGKLFGDRFVLDHLVLMNRSPGSRGRRWHGHPYRDGSYEVQDRVGDGSALTKEYLREQCIRTLCYPEGADDEHGGELAVIPGSHLYRIPYKWDGGRNEGDEEMERDWLPGKIHAFTGEPLKIVHLRIPPGSMVSFVHHMPHFVGYRAPDAPVRWGLLMAYRSPDPNAEPGKWSEGVPPHWAERMLAAGRLSPHARQVFAGDNPVF